MIKEQDEKYKACNNNDMKRKKIILRLETWMLERIKSRATAARTVRAVQSLEKSNRVHAASTYGLGIIELMQQVTITTISIDGAQYYSVLCNNMATCKWYFSAINFTVCY